MKLRTRVARALRARLAPMGFELVRLHRRARLRTGAPMVRRLIESGLLAELRVLDIGCSLGLDDRLLASRPALRALAVDVVIDEIERLQARAAPGERYVAARVGHADPTRKPRRSPWDRLSTAWAMANAPRTSTGLVDNDWHKQRLVPETDAISLDELLRREGFADVDVLKIDIDGADLDVLLDAQALLARAPVMAVELEVNFHGEAGSAHHTFHHTDRVMRENGFELFQLVTRNYSAQALPAPFEYSIYAQTEFGRVLQGDALYMRDVADPRDPRDPRASSALAPRKIVAAAALAELYGLPDTAAEIVLQHRALFGAHVDALLDDLTPELDGRRISYRDYVAAFRRAPSSFFPRRR